MLEEDAGEIRWRSDPYGHAAERDGDPLWCAASSRARAQSWVLTKRDGRGEVGSWVNEDVESHSQDSRCRIVLGRESKAVMERKAVGRDRPALR